MPVPSILLVDDQRDIVRLLHATLDTLGHELEIIDAPSGEEALLEASRRKIDLLVADYLLPGISGVELMRKIQVRSPDLKVIFISGMTDRKVRKEMVNSGAVAIFDKPIPLADFLDAVERSLGLVLTIFPPESNKEIEERRRTISELLGGFRQQITADAIFLISDRGRVLARAGDLPDSSMEVSLLSALMAIYSASLKASRLIHQDSLENYHVFRGGDYELILTPVNSAHALLLTGKGLAGADRILQIVEEMLRVRAEVQNLLQSLGVTPAPAVAETPLPEQPEEPVVEPQESEPEVDLDALFASAGKKSKVKDLDAFWDDAVEKTANAPASPDVISFEEAQKLGLTPGKTMPLRFTGPLKDLKDTGSLNKKK
jgi:CheY-like chemotaxis protein